MERLGAARLQAAFSTRRKRMPSAPLPVLHALRETLGSIDREAGSLGAEALKSLPRRRLRRRHVLPRLPLVATADDCPSLAPACCLRLCPAAPSAMLEKL